MIRVNVRRGSGETWVAQAPLLTSREALGTTAVQAVNAIERIVTEETANAMETARARAAALDENSALAPKRRISVREQIIDYVESRGADGVTADEVEEALGLSHQTGSARFADLVVAGILEPVAAEADAEVRRKTRTKKRAVPHRIPLLIETQRAAFKDYTGLTPDEWLATHKRPPETRHRARRLAGYLAKVFRASKRRRAA